MNINPVVQYLLSTKRPSNSSEETTAQVLLGKTATYHHNDKGEFMAATLIIGDSRTLFSAHLDTVERNSGKNTLQAYVDAKTGHTFVKATNSVLGADDAAGISIMVNMIDNNIAGNYHFYAMEEIGAVGSNWLVSNHPELYANIDRAIAFDRKGTSDVIAVQLGSDCCSNEFALALSDALVAEGLYYEPSEGVFTDTANMVGLVPECTNLSCGYYNEHSNNECLDLTFLESLTDAVLRINWEALPTKRSTVIKERKWYTDDWSGEPTVGYNSLHNSSYDFDAYTNDDVDAVLDLMLLNNVTISDLLLKIKYDDMLDLL